MKKRLSCFLFAFVFAFAAASAAFPALVPSAVSDADFIAPAIVIPSMLVLPDDDMLSENLVYTLGRGSRYEVNVDSLFVDPTHDNREGTINHQKYICIHNTGNFTPTAGAANNAAYCRNPSTAVSWHYTVGNDGIYQQLPVNEIGYHAGNYSSEDPYTNHNTIGIETVDAGIPATGPFGTPYWDTPEVYNWYATQFDLTATYLALHVASLCVRLNFNPYTQIIQHNTCSGKNCPMIMRYVFGTNAQFKHEGTYFKVFLNRMYDFYRAFGGSYTESDTVINEYYNPDKVVYKKGLYRTDAEIKAYRAGNIETGEVGTVPADSTVDVKIVGYDWGKAALADGTEGWIDLKPLTYVSDLHYGSYRQADGTVVNVTKIDGNTACYDGGSADIGTLTRVYKVEVEGDTAFGAEAKYLASGETFAVTAAPPAAPLTFEMWETIAGEAGIADRRAKSTTVKVLDSDIVLRATSRDRYFLEVKAGTGTGSYAGGEAVPISAKQKLDLKFTHWELVSGSGSFENPNAFNTNFTMGADDAVVEARYNKSGVVDLVGLANYALGKSYTAAVNGSETITYYNAKQGDPALSKLADGVLTPGEFGTNKPEFVSYKGAAGDTVSITFDFTKPYNISKVLIRGVADNGGSFGNINSNLATVEFSDDGENFTSAQDVFPTVYQDYTAAEDGTLTKFGTAFIHELEFTEAAGRYARVSFKSTKDCVSAAEVEMYGADTQGPTTPPAPPIPPGPPSTEPELVNVAPRSEYKANSESGCNDIYGSHKYAEAPWCSYKGYNPDETANPCKIGRLVDGYKEMSSSYPAYTVDEFCNNGGIFQDNTEFKAIPGMCALMFRLAEPANIKTVNVFLNNQGNNRGYPDEVKAFVGNEDSFDVSGFTQIGTAALTDDQTLVEGSDNLKLAEFTADTAIPGQYVVIQFNAADGSHAVLATSEVEIFKEVAPPPPPAEPVNVAPQSEYKANPESGVNDIYDTHGWGERPWTDYKGYNPDETANPDKIGRLVDGHIQLEIPYPRHTVVEFCNNGKDNPEDDQFTPQIGMTSLLFRLAETCDVKTVKLYINNKGGESTGRGWPNDIKVFVGNEDSFDPAGFTQLGDIATADAYVAYEGSEVTKVVEFEGDEMISGRYVLIQFNATESKYAVLGASEIEIWAVPGEIEPPPPAPEKYAISVDGGSADKAEAEAGETVTITADAPEEGFKFTGWQIVAGEIALADETAATTTFTMPEGAVELKAAFAELPPAPSEEAFKLTENPIVLENNIIKSEDNKYIFVNDGVKAKDLTSKAFAEGVYTAREPDGALAFGFSVLKTGMTVEDCAKNSITVIVRGDVNGDGNADNLDASMVLQYDAGLIDAGELMLLAGNVSGDGELDNLDAVYILQYDAGIIEKF